MIDHYRPRRTLVALEDYMVDEAPAELTDDVLDSLADALLALKEKERGLDRPALLHGIHAQNGGGDVSVKSSYE